MSNVRLLADHRHEVVIDLASTWVSRIDRGLSPEEEDQLRKWVAADPRHAEAMGEVAGLWDRMDVLAQLAELLPNPKVRRTTSHKGIAYAAVTASVLVLTVTLVFVLLRDSDDVPVEALSYSGTYETAVGGLSKVTLADGSLLTLNTDSRMLVAFDPNRRDLELVRGEVHIDVAPDPGRPFRVKVGDRVVEAVGTAFSVRLHDAQSVEVLVTEGRVTINRIATSIGSEGDLRSLDSISAAEGDRLLIEVDGTSQHRVPLDEINVYLSWRGGNLIFRGETLAQATSEVGRYTALEFVFTDESLKDIRVAGMFRAGDVSGFLASLVANFAIEHDRVDERTIVLRPRQPPSESLRPISLDPAWNAQAHGGKSPLARLNQQREDGR